jgi:hypothetical protein
LNNKINIYKRIQKFGFIVFFWSSLYFLCLKVKLFEKIIVPKKHNVIINWLSKKYNKIIEEYKYKTGSSDFNKISIPKIIWICWWDGIFSMPDIVNSCYKSVVSHSGNFIVNLVTKENYKEYIDFPEYIISKFEKGMISVTHLSDIMRMTLLSKYGGFWLDATVYVTGAINFDNLSFFTVRRNLGGKYVPQQRWTGNCMAGSPDILLFSFVYDIFREYWMEFNEMIDYFLIDYAIAMAYNNIPEVKIMMDNNRQNNENYMVLNRYLHKEYSSGEFNEITADTIFHKLTWKTKHSVLTPDNKLTYFGYVLNQYEQ